MSTSASRTMRSTISLAASGRRSIERLRWLRLPSMKKTLTPSMNESNPAQWRSKAPLGGSILITSAPRSASICTAAGSCRKWVKLRTLTPSNIDFSVVLMGSVQQGAGNDHSLDLRGALDDLQHLRIAERARHRVLADDSVAAVDLHGLVRGFHRALGCEQLGHRCFLVERLAFVLQRR